MGEDGKDVSGTRGLTALGIQLEQLCRAGRRNILLVAPFVKAGTLARLLALVENDLPIKCVTRWRTDEIAIGVSDLEVWPLLRARSGASLWLRSDLHAKYYRADDSCLVGSANLTATALGWSSQPNLELLVPLSAGELQSFETELFIGCIKVDDDLYNHTVAAVELVRQYIPTPPAPSGETAVTGESPNEQFQPVSQESWLPKLRDPADLYVAYSGRLHELTAASQAVAEVELVELPVQSGLPRAAFEACIGVLLLQKPIVRAVDEFLIELQRFGAVCNFLRTLPCRNQPEFNATYAWQTLMRWMFHFLPTRYKRIPSRHSEVVSRS